MANPYRPDVEVHFPPTADETNLRLLSVFHYVAAGLIAVFSSIFITHIVLGARILASHADGADSTFGAIFVAVGTTAVLVGWTMAGLTALAGRAIAQRRRHLFCLVVASISCLWMPFGTLLGVFTLVVLSKPHVKAMFQRPVAEQAYGPIL